MKRLNRFLARNRDKGIKNLMLYICIGQTFSFILSMSEYGSQFIFNNMLFMPSLIFKGQVWRLLSFALIHNSDSVFTLVLSLMFYFFIGRMLEEAWGTLKLNIYYFSGLLIHIIFGFSLYPMLSDSVGFLVYGSMYLNLSLFLAYAALNPDAYVRLYFILPVKVKWLALINFALMVSGFFLNPYPVNLAPCMALVNFLIFFTLPMVRYAKRSINTARQRTKRSKFVRAAREPAARTFRHRCMVCGKTDVSHPNIEFRYCGRCSGYACYCDEHILNHTHID